MPRFLANRFVEVCGVISSLLTVALVIAIEQWTNFSFFTLTFWVVIPVGAFLTGLAAASGYYFGAVITNRRPTKTLLVSMVVIAAGTFFLIHYIQYAMLEIDGKQVSRYISFTTYLQIVLTHAEYSLVRTPNSKFEVGVFGYVIATIQFLAFAAGGFAMYASLAAKPFCERCAKYFKNIAAHQKTFENAEAFQSFSQRLYSLSPPSAEYLHILKEPHDVAKTQPGAVAMHWSLLHCPACHNQLLQELPKVLDKKNNWSDVSKLKRVFAVPSSLPLLPEIQAAKNAKQYSAPAQPKA